LRHIQRADLVASLAGGDSFSDIYGMERLLYVSLPQILVLLLGKRLLLLPQTVGPFRSRWSQAIARFIVRRADRAYSRDHSGVEELRRLAPARHRNDFKFCYDVGLVLDPHKPKDLEVAGISFSVLRRPVVGLNVSGLLYMGGYTRANMFGLRCDYAQLVKSIIRLMITGKSCTVLLVPHVLGTHAESDESSCRRVYDELTAQYPGALGLVQGRYNQHEIKYLIGQCDFFVGSRMHACIAAASQSVPAVSIAYSDKFAGVMQSLGLSNLVADPRILEQDEILRIIDRSFEDRSNICRQLAEKMPKVRSTVLNLFKSVDLVQADPSISQPKEACDRVATV
jgi:polysaccharide pyruvyl transferase WcaK-like protein